MQSRPSAPDLLDAIADLLIKEVMPLVKENDAVAYKTLVSWNMLGVVARELREGEGRLNRELEDLRGLLPDAAVHAPGTAPEKQNLARELNDLLVQRIKSEKIADPEHPVWKHVRATLEEDLAVANPRFNTK